ncbi:MAG: pantoate--beta-alanine ligase [Mariprofundales bacterium]
MKIVHQLNALADPMRALRHEGTVALVPTMGALHDGHMALIRRARELADAVVVSIYVNPRQFAAGEDFSCYPRMLEQDRARCAQAGVDLLLAPQSLYAPDGAKVTLKVDVALTDCLCGRNRPDHFDGVATVVAVLFHLVRPDVALFGHKDFQQLQVIRRMVADLFFPLRIVSVPTLREVDGLALSSRNLRLTAEGRALAPQIYVTMQALQQMMVAGSCLVADLEAEGRRALAAAGVTVEYLEIRDSETLAKVAEVSASSRLFVAATIDGVRLIDNLALGDVI